MHRVLLDDPVHLRVTHQPRYAKFLKDLLTSKKILKKMSMVTLSEECSAVLTNQIPKKRRDLESFIGSCTI